MCVINLLQCNLINLTGVVRNKCHIHVMCGTDVVRIFSLHDLDDVKELISEHRLWVLAVSQVSLLLALAQAVRA